MNTQNNSSGHGGSHKFITCSLNVTSLPKRFQKKIQLEVCPIPGLKGKCWIWTSNLNEGGYGRIHYKGRPDRMAHKVTYELLRGPIPEGLVLDHLCRVTACVNPDHLEAVTSRENVKRGLGIGVYNSSLTHCRRGHEFTTKNTMIWRGKRWCRACGRIRQEIYEAKRKAVSA